MIVAIQNKERKALQPEVAREVVRMSMGANAVVGMRFQTSMIQSGAAEMLCYGTAVIVETDG